MLKRTIIKIALWIIVIMFCTVLLVPVILTVSASFGVGGRGVSLEGYIDFYIWKPLYLNAFLRSFFIAALSTICALIIAVPAAFVFAKVKFKGKLLLFYAYVIVMILPFQVTMLPQYMTARQLGIYDTPFALILPCIFSCLPVFLLTQVTKTVQNEIIEAAVFDTSNVFVILLKIIVPNIKHGIICTAVLSFSEQWNAVAEPLILLESEDRYPLAVILDSSATDDLYALAATVIFMLPPFLLLALFSNEILDGLGEFKLK